MDPAAKLEMVVSLIKRTETHVCDKCGQGHTIELGLLTAKEAMALLVDTLEGKDVD